MLFRTLFFGLLGVVFSYNIIAQPITKDTIYLPDPDYPDKVWKIESKRNGKKFGPTISYKYVRYDSVTLKPFLHTYQFYIQDSLYGSMIVYEHVPNYYLLVNYHHNDTVFEKTISDYKLIYESSHATYPFKIRYAPRSNNIRTINYPLSREVVELYYNQRVKSLQILNNTIPATRSYYEFSYEGVLLVEGTFADSFVTVIDDIIRWSESLDEDREPIIITHEEPLKHGEWLYYSDQGILQERKVYTYFTEKSIYIKEEED